MNLTHNGEAPGSEVEGQLCDAERKAAGSIRRDAE